MDIQETTLLIAAISSAIISIIYSMKHIKKSTCWGSSCTQEVKLTTIVEESHV